MAQSDSQVISTHIAVSGGVAQITMGELRIAVPVGNIEPLIRILQAARLIAGNSSEMTAVAPAPVARVASEPRRTAPPVRTATPVAARRGAQASGSKRRSRKRVGDALEVWMQQHPGWHSESTLLQAVVDNRMTDASPKRALKIALGKQRDELFEGDGSGNWKLVRDANAGAPPKAGSRAAANAAAATERRGRVAKSASESVAAADRAGEAAARRGGRVRLKTRPRTSPHTPPIPPREAVEEPRAATGPKRVKKGERQKSAARDTGPNLPPGVELGSDRWRGVSRDELERARKNLLGVGSGAGVRGPDSE